MFNDVITTVHNGVVTVKSTRVVFFKELIAKVATKKIYTNVFIKLSSNEVTFYEFFANEVVEILSTLLSMPAYGLDIRSIKRAMDGIIANTWLNQSRIRDTDPIDYDAIKSTMKFSILPQQQDFFDYYEKEVPRLGLKGALLHGKAGTGKTFMSLALSEGIHAQKVIVVCPLNALRRVWGESLEKTLYKTPQHAWYSDSNKSYNGEKFIVVHYEYLAKALKIAKEFRTNKTIVILDESHYLNDSKTQRSNYFKTLCDLVGTNDIILASGTPIKALGTELVPILSLLDPLFTSAVKARFIRAFKGTSNKGLGNRLLRERLGLIRVVIEKKDMGLGKVIPTQVPIKLSNWKEYTIATLKKKMATFIKERVTEYTKNYPKYEAIYNQVIEEYRTSIDKPEDKQALKIYLLQVDRIKRAYRDNNLSKVSVEIVNANRFEKEVLLPRLSKERKKEFRDAKSIVKYMKLKVQGECLGIVVSGTRVQCHKDIAREMDYDAIIRSSLKKTVIFSNNVEVCDQAYISTTKLGYKPARVYGDYTGHINQSVSKFLHDPSINPMVATYTSLSTAIPLISANVLIMIDMPYRVYIYEQAIARVHRLDQHEDVYVYQMLLDTGDEPNINSRGFDIIKWSKEQVEELTGLSVEYEVVGKELNESKPTTGVSSSFVSMFTSYNPAISIGKPKKTKRTSLAW